MRREHKRHPFFEFLVFGMALLLVAILLFYAGRAMFGGRGNQAAVVPTPDVSPVAKPAARNLPHDLDVGPTERGVNKLPPVEVSRVAKPSRRTREVPAPR